MKRSRYDALGRLVQVTDDPGGANLIATYSYDANDQLAGVDQGGQHRDFIYDALRRLRTVQNPESGTTLYAYDAGGNLRTKFDQRGITTTYTYDALDRLTAKSASDGSVNVAYGYDASSVPYSAGRLTSVGNGAAARYTTAYDAQGRITASSQVTAGQTYSFNCPGSSERPSPPAYHLSSLMLASLPISWLGRNLDVKIVGKES